MCNQQGGELRYHDGAKTNTGHGNAECQAALAIEPLRDDVAIGQR